MGRDIASFVKDIVEPIKISNDIAKKLLIESYHSTGKEYAVYRLSDSGQHILSRLEIDPSKTFHLRNIPIYKSGLHVRVGTNTMTNYSWNKYLLELLVDGSLLNEDA